MFGKPLLGSLCVFMVVWLAAMFTDPRIISVPRVARHPSVDKPVFLESTDPLSRDLECRVEGLSRELKALAIANRKLTETNKALLKELKNVSREAHRRSQKQK